MPLIAITWEMGSPGQDVAQGVSQACGVPLVHHEIAERLAQRMRMPRGRVERLLSGSAGPLERLTADTTSLAILAAAEIFDFAMQGRGAVIGGCGASQVLRGVAHAVRVRVYSPMGVRRQRTDPPQHYDAAFNGERLSVGECVDAVMGLVNCAAFRETAASRRQLEDLALASCMRAALRMSSRTRGLHVAVSAESGRVTLAGIVRDAEQRAAVGEVAAALAGRRELHDQIRALDGLRPRFG